MSNDLIAKRYEHYNNLLIDLGSFCYRGNQIPEYMRGALARYVAYGTVPEDFLLSVICNDLRKACQEADSTNIEILHVYIAFLYNNVPAGCWGSKERLKFWVEHKKKEEDEQADSNLSRELC